MSSAGHIIMFSVLGLVPPPSEVLAMREAEFEFLEPPPEVEVEEPPPEPEEPEPEPEPEPQRPAPQQAPEPPPEEEPPPEPPAEEIADFTGVTLTADGAGGWSTVVGSGAPLKGPVGKIGNKQGSADKAPAAKSVRGPKVLPAKSLARRPSPPGGLNAALQRHFPPRARMQGVEGTVVLAVRVLPDGRLGRMSVRNETPSGYDFGSACRRTLREMGSWKPPLGPGGEAVSTDISFTCSFEVMY